MQNSQPPPLPLYNMQGTTNIPPPPAHHRPHVRPPPKKSSGGLGCCRCMCFCCCFLLLFLIVSAALTYYLYTLYKPKPPSYTVHDFTVKAFDVQPDRSLKTELFVEIKAVNPNSKISFIYGTHSNVSVFYNKTMISTGKLPSFEQGHENTTIMAITLKGTSSGSGLEEAVIEKKNNGQIPLQVEVTVPAKIVVVNYAFREFRVLVKCDLVVENVEPNKQAKVVKNDCKPNIKL